MNNIAIRQFETQLYELINGVPLPNEVKRTIVELALIKITNAADADINAELKQIGEVEHGQMVGQAAEAQED